MERLQGVAAAVEAIRQEDADAFALDRSEQLSLLPDGREAAAAAERRQAGRPKGSRNKRTSDMRAAIEGRLNGNPLLILADRYGAPPPEVLAVRLGITKEDAAKLQIAVLRELGLYTDQKLPQSVALAVESFGPAPTLVLSPETAAAIGYTAQEIAGMLAGGGSGPVLEHERLDGSTD